MWRRTLILIVLSPLAGVQSVSAQTGFRGGGDPRLSNYLNRKPVLSPYLNMFRVGEDANNYYNLVQPQMDQLKLNRQNDSNFDSLQRQLSNMSIGSNRQTTTPSTGHSTGFMNYSHFHGNSPAAGGGGMRGSASARSRGAAASGGSGYGSSMARSMLGRFGGGGGLNASKPSGS